MSEENTFTVTDRTGETRAIRKNEFVTVIVDERIAYGFHLKNVKRQGEGMHMHMVGDGVWVPVRACRFVTPSDHPASGRVRLTDRRTGAWVESDSRNYIDSGGGYWQTGLFPPVPKKDAIIEGSPGVIIPRIRTFGRLETDDWLAAKQREESGELLDAAREWLNDPTAEHRTAMLDELADLLQTIANMCAAYHIDVRDIADALDRCWKKNMRREQPDDSSAESMLIRLGIRPNATVRDRETGRTLTVLPSDTWGRRLDTAKVGVYETDWRHPEWLPFTRLEPVEGKDGANDD